MTAVAAMTANQVIDRLDLVPHPEGGHFRETWRHDVPSGGRGCGTAIYYLLKDGERSHWHRVDAAEIWHWYAGAPLALDLSDNGDDMRRVELGPQIDTDQRPQIIIAKGTWQSASTLGAWTLVGCTVSPAFQFDGFEMAPPGWRPGTGA